MKRALFLLLLAGCYQTPKPACAFLCGEGDACPDGYECGDDNRCHRVESNGSLAACPDSLPIDANTPIDSSTLDAALDAPIDGPSTPACATALAPVSDGTSAARQAILIAEVDPGAHIELFNNTGADIVLDASTVTIASGSMTADLSAVGAGLEIPAGGRAVIAWPIAFSDAMDAGGEVVLYLDPDGTPAPDEIMSFVCWGTGGGTLKTDAEANGKWTAAGACPLALVGGAIHRLPATDGKDAADFDITSAPSPETCAP